jgi:hypothetical protein
MRLSADGVPGGARPERLILTGLRAFGSVFQRLPVVDADTQIYSQWKADLTFDTSLATLNWKADFT